MKNLKKVFFFIFLVHTITWISPAKVDAQVSVNFQVFYDDLSPYGSWVDNPSYGYVWVPNVDQGFAPYRTNGHWVFTDAGWTWFSDYPWGWAPFHYGRWYTDPAYGPMWVPGNEWGPGWVTWRQSQGYYGWAPIEPGISINVAYSNGYNVPNDRWVFVRDRDFGRTNINNYYINNSSNTTIIRNSSVINNMNTGAAGNTRYHSGPERKDVEKHIGKSISPIAIKESSNHSQRLEKNQLEIYRPQIKNADNAGHKPMPPKVVDLKEVKPFKERGGATKQVDKQPGNLHNEKQTPVKQQPANQTDKKQLERQQNERQMPVKQQPGNQSDKHQPANAPGIEKQINKQPMESQPNRQETTPDRRNNQQERNQNQPPVREPRDRGVKQPPPQLHNRKQGDPEQQHNSRENTPQKSNDQPASPNERKDDQNKPHE